MKAAVVSLGSKSSEWVATELRKHCTVDELDIRDIEVNLTGTTAEVLHKGAPLGQYDCVYAKGSYRYATLLRALTTVLQDRSYLPLRAHAFTTGHDKLLTHLKLQQAGVPMPRTYVVATADAARKVLKTITYPIVLKMPAGTHGKGVMIADSPESAKTMVDTLALLRQPFLIQQYIETDGVDTRAFVIGDTVVASMERVATKGEKRANVHQGGKPRSGSLDSKSTRAAIAAARACGCDICAVDMLMSPKGPLVIEINVSPGLQSITKCTEKNIAAQIADYLMQRTKKKLGRQGSDLLKEVIPGEEVSTTPEFRGERMLLPAFVTGVTRLTAASLVTITADKDSVVVRRKGEKKERE